MEGLLSTMPTPSSFILPTPPYKNPRVTRLMPGQGRGPIGLCHECCWLDKFSKEVPSVIIGPDSLRTE